MTIAQHQSAYAIWLASVAPDLEAIYQDTTHRGRSEAIPVTVERLTNTQIITHDKHAREFRFRRDNGAIVGTARGRLEQYTQAIVDEIEFKRMNHWFKNKLPEMRLTLEQMHELHSAVLKITAPKDASEKAE